MKIFTWKQRGIVWGTTVFSLTLMGGAGYILDHLLGTEKIFFIVGLLGSFPLNAFLIKRNVLKYGIDESIRPSAEVKK